MSIKRRTLFQQIGMGGLAWGSWEIARSLLGKELFPALQALADPAARKLALLVGLDRYPQGQFLRGSLTDIERQYDLLASRFGFAPGDICPLGDDEATREQIETAFREHLIAQARPGDIVVFHFSGFGRQLRDGDRLLNSLMGANAGAPGLFGTGIDDVLLATLARLGRSLATDRVVYVLDTSYPADGQTLQGNFRRRTYPNTQIGSVPAAERELEQLATNGENTSLPGIVLAAAARERQALEGNWGGFDAGLFSYALTQTLWQALPGNRLYVSFDRVAQTVRCWHPQQQPQLETIRDRSQFSPYDLPLSSRAADAIVTAIAADGTVELKLTGIPLAVMLGYSDRSRLESGENGQVEIISRQGPIARAQITRGPELAIGEGLRESVRVVPFNSGLTLAFDANFNRIERVDATSALANLPAIANLTTAGEGAADCVFARNYGGGYGLFFPSGQPVPGTLGSENEAIKSAASRLLPYLDGLLAAKLWRMLLNAGTSHVGLQVSLQGLEPDLHTAIARATPAFPERDRLRPSSVPTLAMGLPVRYLFANASDRRLYLFAIGLSASGQPVALVAPDEVSVEPGATRAIPPSGSEWRVSGPEGVVELYAIASVEPFTRTRAALSARTSSRGSSERLALFSDPGAIVRALQDDLQAASAVPETAIDPSRGVFALDVRRWAALDFVYRVARA